MVEKPFGAGAAKLRKAPFQRGNEERGLDDPGPSPIASAQRGLLGAEVGQGALAHCDGAQMSVGVLDVELEDVGIPARVGPWEGP